MSLLQFGLLNPNICSSVSNWRPSAANKGNNVIKASNVCEKRSSSSSSSSWWCSYVHNNRERGVGAFFPASAPPSSGSRRRLLCPPVQGKHVREDYLVKKLSSEEVEQLVRGDRKVPIVLDFYATWCGPCILMAQELEMLAVEYESNAIIVKVDTDDEYEFARDMQVRGLPTLYFISADPNKEAIRTEGLISLEMMRDIIDNEM